MAVQVNDNQNISKIIPSDHREIGLKQKLFYFHESSPGSCFFLPRGTMIYNTLIDFIRREYRNRGYQEIITPNIYNKNLWETSGHWKYYSKNMFKIELDNDTYALKPMNCCGHCLIFENTNRSYRELPLRFADFGVLHRNEAHGALTGLTRVRRFQQDDAHIFCTEEQIESEINNCLDFLKYVYGIFGFEFSLALSTRPESYSGTLEVWEKAEKQLAMSLDKSGFKWTTNPGDGAFYGPKIDITIKDAIGRNHQCATIQLDFNLPERFGLSYQKSDGSNGRPVMIHRAILGSVERMIAILVENYDGKWPFWLSPRQICIIPVDPKFNDYANEVYQIYHTNGFNVELDTSTDKLNKKIRNAQIEQFNFIFVVGEKEQKSGTVNVRTRDSNVLGTFIHANVLEKLYKLKNIHSLDNIF
jgi:threonyl-tRNA synthetase